MERLFSMFPQGTPGLALLLLRFLVAVMFPLLLMKCLAHSPHLIVFLGLAMSALIAIGFLTPIAAVLVCASGLVALTTYFRGDSMALICIIVNSAALALLGPGAYSVDARLFGRRVIVFSSRNN